MDEITHTIMPGNTGGWGGTALGAGVGGLVGSWLGNGGFGGFGCPGQQAARSMQNKPGAIAITDGARG